MDGVLFLFHVTTNDLMLFEIDLNDRLLYTNKIKTATVLFFRVLIYPAWRQFTNLIVPWKRAPSRQRQK
jgi:hypothetical protein